MYQTQRKRPRKKKTRKAIHKKGTRKNLRKNLRKKLRKMKGRGVPTFRNSLGMNMFTYPVHNTQNFLSNISLGIQGLPPVMGPSILNQPINF